MRALFIPCWHDGLPRDSGSAQIRAQWVCDLWEDADVWDLSGRLPGYDLYVFQKAYLIGQTRSWINTVAQWRDEGRCVMAFDLCDPDFLDLEHRRRMLEVLPLFDFAVGSTRPITDWLARWLPAYHIPDRVSLTTLEEVGRRAVYTDNDPPRVVWAGYEHNLGSLDAIRDEVEGLGVELDVLALAKPLPFVVFWGSVLDYDVLLNPRPDKPPFSYKSDNKTLIAWGLGLPVARTVDELLNLCDHHARTAEGVKRANEVAVSWGMRSSVLQWQEICRSWRGDVN